MERNGIWWNAFHLILLFLFPPKLGVSDGISLFSVLIFIKLHFYPFKPKPTLSTFFLLFHMVLLPPMLGNGCHCSTDRLTPHDTHLRHLIRLLEQVWGLKFTLPSTYFCLAGAWFYINGRWKMEDDVISLVNALNLFLHMFREVVFFFL